MSTVLAEGKALATYNQPTVAGYLPLRQFLTQSPRCRHHCTADDILIVSGSLQALGLVNQTLLARGDTG